MTRSCFSVLLSCIACLLSTSLTCQAQQFSPGEIVQAKAYGETIEVKVLKQDSSGVQVLLKDWQDGTFKPGGSSRYYQASELTKIGATPSNNAAGGQTTYTSPAAAQMNRQEQADMSSAADLDGSGPLSKQQLVNFLRANVGTDGPHPKKDAINAKAIAAVKKRGVNFKYSWQDLPDFSKAGGNQALTYAIQDNFGAPTNNQWLLGAWELQFTNATGFFASRDSAAKMGFVSIEPGHTYIWKIHEDDPPNKWIEGKWRDATAEEMKYHGGAGLVLLNGEQNWDWIVHKDMTANSGEWINVADLGTRQVIRSGMRKLN